MNQTSYDALTERIQNAHHARMHYLSRFWQPGVAFIGWLALSYYLDEKLVLAIGLGAVVFCLHHIHMEAALTAMNIRVAAEASFYQLHRPGDDI